MQNEMMNVKQLAAYLHRDVRDVKKMVDRGRVPGHKVSGEWRFARAEINYWVETRLHECDEAELTAFEKGGRQDGHQESLLSDLLNEACVAVPLLAGTRGSVIREMVKLAEQSWQVYDPEAILDAVQKREEESPTALPGGVALLHPRRPNPGALGDSILAFGRTSTSIPFGAPGGGMTDLFFLLLSRDDTTHLRVLARLTRILFRPGFLDQLRLVETPNEAFTALLEAEQELLA